MSSAASSAGSRLLWLFAFGLSLLGVLLLVLGLLGSAPRGGDLVGVNPGDTISIGDGGMSMWSPDPGTRAETVCTLGTGTMARPDAEHGTTVEGSEFFEVARTADQTPAGTYVVSCNTQDPVYAGPYGPAVAAPSLLGLAGPTSLVGGLILLALGAVSMALARSSRRPAGPT